MISEWFGGWFLVGTGLVVTFLIMIIVNYKGHFENEDDKTAWLFGSFMLAFAGMAWIIVFILKRYF